MEKLFLLILTMAAALSYLNSKYLVLSANYTIESPKFIVLYTQPEFEIRLYKEMSWMSAPVNGTTSFHNSTKEGFHRLYQYLHGANLNSTQFLMTAPVLTSIKPQSSAFVYTIRYFMPSKYDKVVPPPPATELNLQFDRWKSKCTAVRKFPGYAGDDNVDKEKDALVSSLGKQFPGLLQAARNKYNYSIAQYNASKHTTGRVNEVWMDVSGFTANGCPI